jgi:Fe2+ transport system protein FeoA
MRYLLSLYLIISVNCMASNENIESCKAITGLYKAGDINATVEEARWCLEGLEQIKQGQVGELFLKEHNGWKRTSFKNNKTMGMSITNAEYKKANKKIKIAMMSGQSGLGALSALSSMGMQAGKKVRIQRRTGVNLSQGKKVNIMVNLKSGGTLAFESYNASYQEVLDFAKKYPVAKIDDANK